MKQQISPKSFPEYPRKGTSHEVFLWNFRPDTYKVGGCLRLHLLAFANVLNPAMIGL